MYVYHYYYLSIDGINNLHISVEIGRSFADCSKGTLWPRHWKNVWNKAHNSSSASFVS